MSNRKVLNSIEFILIVDFLDALYQVLVLVRHCHFRRHGIVVADNGCSIRYKDFIVFYVSRQWVITHMYRK